MIKGFLFKDFMVRAARTDGFQAKYHKADCQQKGCRRTIKYLDIFLVTYQVGDSSREVRHCFCVRCFARYFKGTERVA